MADPIAKGLVNLGGGSSLTVLVILLALLVIAGISIFMIFCPLFVPVAQTFGRDLRWFGVVSCRLARASMESTVPWVVWILLFIGLVLRVFCPWLVLWLPQVPGFM